LALQELELVSTRIVPYPRELVFRAYTDPKILVRWWGPNGFTNTFQEYVLKPGGDWRFIMHGPNGANYANHIRFIEISPSEKLVLDHVSPPKFVATIQFENHNEKTKVMFVQRFESKNVFDSIQKIAYQANKENFDRLESALRSIKS